MIYLKALYCKVAALMALVSSAGLAQNHNPKFEVSNLSFGGDPYIIIGEDDSASSGVRTEVELKFRNQSGVARDGTTTLEWVVETSGVQDGAASVLAFEPQTINPAIDESDGLIPFVMGERDENNFPKISFSGLGYGLEKPRIRNMMVRKCICRGRQIRQRRAQLLLMRVSKSN